MQVMIDVVYNHTAHDSVLVKEHPEWFHQDKKGRPLTTVPDWSDVIDLNHPIAELSACLIETLQGWATFGIDGFRCDVASLVPESFWTAARQAVAAVKPGVVWLAESVHASFVAERRDKGLFAQSDSQLYRAFDLTYDYDIWPIWQAAVTGRVPVSRYLEMLRFQDCIYPVNFVKMRCVENHDQARIQKLAPSRAQALAWTAFQAFNKGAFLIYSGQEAAASHTPSLFESDKIEWGNYELQPFLTKLTKIKKNPALIEGQFVLLDGEPVVQAAWQHPESGLYGVFNVSGTTSAIEVQLPDGNYPDLLSETTVTVKDGQIPPPESAVILRYGEARQLRPIYSELLDFYFPPC
jgi:glycosidase